MHYCSEEGEECVDFYFPLAVMWFGVPDPIKKRTDQLTYRIRGASATSRE